MVLSSLLKSIGYVAEKFNHYKKDHFLILMYHRVVYSSETENHVEPGMYVEPETFQGQIGFLKNLFEIISFRDLYLKMFHKEPCNQRTKPLCILTFDDGWHDFYEYVFPILLDHGVPATVFLPTDYIGTNNLFWTDRFTYMFVRFKYIMKNKIDIKKSKNELINRLENLDGNKETILGKAINILKEYPNNIIEETLYELKNRWNIDKDISGPAFLTWEEVDVMSKSGIVSFGSHTASHKILTLLTEGEAWNELIKSKQTLCIRKVVDSNFIPFCYPNGYWNEKTAKLVENAGYSIAVTTDKGWNRYDSGLFSLKRIGIHQDMTITDEMMICRILGIL